MEGFGVMSAFAAAALGEVFITVTGAPDVLRREHFELMRDGAVLANAGHFDVEISLADLRALAAGRRARRSRSSTSTIGGRRLHLVAKGRVVNLAAGAGHPASVMDLSFAAQALAVAGIARRGRGRRAGGPRGRRLASTARSRGSSSPRSGSRSTRSPTRRSATCGRSAERRVAPLVPSRYGHTRSRAERRRGQAVPALRAACVAAIGVFEPELEARHRRGAARAGR